MAIDTLPQVWRAAADQGTEHVFRGQLCSVVRVHRMKDLQGGVLRPPLDGLPRELIRALIQLDARVTLHLHKL